MHPILHPKKYFLERIEQGLPYHLECTIKLNSSYFINGIITRAFGDTLDNIFNGNRRRDAYIVQAMLLFRISLHAKGMFEQAVTFSGRDGYRTQYASKRVCHQNGEGLAVPEGSWRRTWWEVYAVDSITACVCPLQVFDLYDVEADVLLRAQRENILLGQMVVPLGINNRANYFDVESQNYYSRILTEQPSYLMRKSCPLPIALM
jgi:hypothetical protein